MAVTIAELAPINCQNWLALGVCIYGKMPIDRALSIPGVRNGNNAPVNVSVEEIKALRDEGMSFRQIAVILGISFQTVRMRMVNAGLHEVKKVKVKRVSEYAQLPTRGSKDAAGLDLYCPFHIKVPADSQKKIPLGIAVEIPKGRMGLLVPRSSMSKTPLRCANSVGVIDADYRGELSIAYENVSCSDYTIFRGDRIAQLIIVPVAMVDVEEVNGLSETERGTGGYGSTGK